MTSENGVTAFSFTVQMAHPCGTSRERYDPMQDENRRTDPVRGRSAAPAGSRTGTDLPAEEPDEIVSWYIPRQEEPEEVVNYFVQQRPMPRTSGSRPPRPSASAAVCGRGWA